MRLSTNNMAEQEHLSDAQIAAELKSYGETIQFPINHRKRPILLKKLNHLRAKSQMSASTSSRDPYQKVSTTTYQYDDDNYTTDRGKQTQTANTSISSRRKEGTKSSLKVKGNSHNQVRPSTIQTFSSDEDEELSQSASFNYGPSKSGKRNVAEEIRSSQLSNSALRSPTHRTTVQSRRIHENDVLYTMNDNDSISTVEDEVPGPTSTSSKLYPDLSKFTSYFSLSDAKNDTFESSDSDIEDSTNTYLKNQPNGLQNTYSQESRYGTKPKIGNISTSSSSNRATTSRRDNAGGPDRFRILHQKSQYLDNLSGIFIWIVILFFLVLATSYVLIHKDIYLSWLSSSSNMGSGNELLLCKDGIKDEDCYPKDLIDKALLFLQNLFENLSSRKGHVLCGAAKPGDEFLQIKDMKRQIDTDFGGTNKMLECCLEHILRNPHWKIRTLKADGSPATILEDVSKLDTDDPTMSILCRLRRSLYAVLYELCVTIIVIGLLILLFLYIKYRLKQKDIEQREVYTMVENIIEILRDQYEQTSDGQSDEPSYLAVQHVRDQLLAPASRYKLQPIWDKAVAFIAANESRIRMETRLIHGDEFDVWSWLQPTTHSDKARKTHDFGADSGSERRINQIAHSPTPCLKISNVFDVDVDDDNWKSYLIDAILEKCKNLHSIVHIAIDDSSDEACVYMKFSDNDTADQASRALSSWRFDGQMVTVEQLRPDHYHKRWPEAHYATRSITR